MKTNNLWRCDLKSPCVKFCESKYNKNQCGIYVRDNMTKELTKEQFRELAFSVIDRKNIIHAKMELSPDNIGSINENVYKIEVKEFEDLVILEKINDN